MVQQTSGVKDFSSLVRYDDISLAAIRHVQSIIPVVRPRPNMRSHSLVLEIVYLDLYSDKVWGFSIFSFCTPPGDISDGRS